MRKKITEDQDTVKSQKDMEVTRPCITIGTRLAEAKFQELLDLESALMLLSGDSLLGEVKISLRAGVLKSYGVVKILLFEDGTITLKPAESYEYAYIQIKRIGSLLRGAVKCPKVNLKPARLCDKTHCPAGCIYFTEESLSLEDEKSKNL